ncbi:MAG TPA: tripartite tricarboxylate transporter substrate-binding protein [Pseudolabrys sp.]|nr:tripartite tricarboxylate transporter substrate-binding protein [Pseudolabrys sp.]
MKLIRREFLHVAVVAAALPTLPRITSALDYPMRTVRVIVPFAPGGPLDVFGRLMAEKLSEYFREQFYIENIGGAGGNIGTGRAAKAAPDGYTLLLTANNHIINPLLYESVPYDAFKDFEPVALAVSFPTALSVNPSVPARTVAELVALVRATPGKYSFASAGVGTPSHLLGERFRQKLSLDLVHVPYNGSGPATAAVMAGDTPVCFAALTAAAPLAQAGRVRVLATMSNTRSQALPEVPTIIEAGYAGLDGEGWDGIFVPVGTPRQIVKLLGDEIRKIVALPEVASRIEALGFSPVAASSDAFAKQLANESATWSEVIHAAGLKMQ